MDGIKRTSLPKEKRYQKGRRSPLAGCALEKRSISRLPSVKDWSFSQVL
jgi:hypothetical protein